MDYLCKLSKSSNFWKVIYKTYLAYNMAQSHHINKLKLTVSAPRSADGFALQSRMSQRFWEAIVPALSDIFDRYVAEDAVLKIDRLDIDLKNMSFKNWEHILPASLCRAIEAELELLQFDSPSIQQLFKGIKVEKQTVTQSQFEAWLYFLETGQLPPTASLETDWRQAALDSVASNTNDLDRLRGLFLRHKTVIERLVLQHDEPFLIHLTEAMSGRKQAHLKTLRESFEAVLTADVLRQQIKQATATASRLTLPSARDLEVAFWQKVFEYLVHGVQTIDSQNFVNEYLHPFFNETIKNDYISFLKTILVWEMAMPPKGRDSTDTPPSVSEAFHGDFRRKEVAFSKEQNLEIAPAFIQFIKSKAANAEIAAAFIRFFENDIKQHQTAIQRLVATSIESIKADTDVLKTAKREPQTDRENKENQQLGTTDIEPLKSDNEGLNTIKRESQTDRENNPKPETEVHTSKTETDKDTDALDLMSKGFDENDEKTATDKINKDDAEGESTDKTSKRGENAQSGEADSESETLLENNAPIITQTIAPHAGLVLLHPFLKPFFESLSLCHSEGILRGGTFNNKKAQRRAAALLHYLATDATEMAEYDMSMPKLLVGLPLEQTLDRRIVLTDLERTEADDLLNATIKHWKALGDTSRDGLREAFLQRSGKLTHRSDGWLLQVEPKTLDILIDRLPWGLSIVQLSWMKEMLFVEWQ